MNAPPPPSAPVPASAPMIALAVTLAVQALASFSLAVPSVLAPAVASEFGMQAQHVGWLVSVAYLTAMLAGLSCGALSRRHGPVRMSQFALLAMAVALVCCVFTQAWLLLLAGVLIGVGYGIPNPTAADILSRHSPRERRGLFFSIKQTGVPAGVAITGVLIPFLVALIDWRSALLVMACVLLVVALLIGGARRSLDPPRGPQAAPAASGEPASGIFRTLTSSVWQPLRIVFENPSLRRLGLVSLVYAFTQVVYLSFLVSALKIEHQMSLTAAAALLSASQIVSMVARVGWGYVSDRWVDPGRLLGLLGLGMSASLMMLAFVPVGASPALMLGVTVVCAATAVSWNGVFYADLVRHVAPAEVTRATGATQFLTFMGGVTGGAGFVGLLSLTGSYSAGFAVVALIPLVTALFMLRSAARSR
ncbi:MAG: MFS transporter [Burkholderiaceae bacterium]